ncbi:MAG: single-stranded DNA-binding protein [Clostridiales bacterium]|jgi:single-stranded DNA-binding protein|nr:single-stranded DNA-binding protein [Clostridiales bacterium]
MDEITNNKVEMIGEIISDFRYSHHVYGEDFYSFTLKVNRLSSSTDNIIVTLSSRLLANNCFKTGDVVKISGQFRSYNNYAPTGNRLILTVFARKVERLDMQACNTTKNSVFLNAFICKQPVYRTTPFGREIADTLVAVNRTYNKSDYIPCIAWGRNARFISGLAIGTNIFIWGRAQSREYEKKIDENETVTKTAYEVSINKLEVK